jgi:hypothetical protein
VTVENSRYKNDLFFILRIISAGLRNDFTPDTIKRFYSSVKRIYAKNNTEEQESKSRIWARLLPYWC